LGDALRAELSAPILIDNCARTLGQAEAWRGAGREARRAVVALWGVGVGAAIAVGSTLAESGSSSTSEWGHAVIEARGRACRCGSHGCLEAYVGAVAILEAYLAHPAGRPFDEDGTEARMAELARRAAAGGDEAATATLDDVAEYLGIGVANLINLINPDQVILAGWVGETLGPLVMPAIRAAAQRYALPYLFDQTRISVGELGPGAVALGAATLPVARLLAAGGQLPA
jgi:predicted NBD/HSP70 family sugar kinase